MPYRWRCPEKDGEVLSLREELRNKSYMGIPQPSGFSSLENKGIGEILIYWSRTFFLLMVFTNPSLSASFVIWQNVSREATDVQIMSGVHHCPQYTL